MNNIMTFKRREIKYLLDDDEYNSLKERLQARLVEDEHGRSTICNIYYDTPDFRIIRKSLEKPVYKEKLRLRSYGVPDDDSEVFIELKKKYKSVVYKRRLEVPEQEAMDYLVGGQPLHKDCQIGREIDYFMQIYKDLEPAVVLSYERNSYKGIDDPELRITFDYNILWQNDDLTLQKEPYGHKVIPEYKVLMEIKMAGGFPLWLSHLLTKYGAYKTSFSKYGEAYKQMVG